MDNDYSNLIYYKELSSIKKSITVSFKIIFFIKNHGRLKYMPMKEISIYKENYFKFFEKESYIDYFKDYLNNKELIHREIFKEQLILIEKSYNFYLGKTDFVATQEKCFLYATKSVFFGNFKKGYYIFNFLLPNFSFTLKKFTTYDPDAFFTKDFKIVSKNFKVNKKLKYNNPYIENDFLVNKEDILTKRIETFVNLYNTKSQLKGVFLKNLMNLDKSISLKKDFDFFDLYGFKVIDKRPLHFDMNFCSEYVYKLHYLLLNNIFSDNLYNKGKIDRHPLVILFPKIILNNFSLEEINILCFSIITSIEKRILFNRRYYHNQISISEFLYSLEKGLEKNKNTLINYLSYINKDNYYKIEENIYVFDKNNITLNKWKMELFLKEKILLEDIIFEKKKISYIHLKEKLSNNRLVNINYIPKKLKNLYLISFENTKSLCINNILKDENLSNYELVLFRVFAEDMVLKINEIKKIFTKELYLDLIQTYISYFKYYTYNRNILHKIYLFYCGKFNEEIVYLGEKIDSLFLENLYKEKLTINQFSRKLNEIYYNIFPHDDF